MTGLGIEVAFEGLFLGAGEGSMVSLNPCAALRSATESESCPFAMTERDRIAKLIIVCIQGMVICFERLVNLAADTTWSTRVRRHGNGRCNRTSG